MTATVSAGTAAAADLITIDGLTTTAVGLLLLDHRYCRKYCDRMSSTGITDAAMAATLDAGTAAAADLITIDSNTTTAVAATAVTAITGTAANIATVLASTGITDAANVTATVSAALLPQQI